MVKVDWECWKKLEERFSDLDEDDQDEACEDKRMRQRQNVDPLQHAQEMDMLPYSLSPSPQQHGSPTPRALLKENRERQGAKGQGHS
jgi:hypothetical protein